MHEDLDGRKDTDMDARTLERLADAHHAGLSASEIAARTRLPWAIIRQAIVMDRDRRVGAVGPVRFIQPPRRA